MKAHTLNPAKSDEKFLEELLDGYVQAARIRARDGSEFHLNKARTSKLLGGKANVPEALLAGTELFGIEDATADKMDAYVQDFIGPDAEEPLIEEVLALATDDVSRARLQEIATDLPKFLARALLMSLRGPNIAINEGTLWSRGTGALAWKESDIFSVASRGTGQAIVVIPVNTGFDIHVTRKKEGVTSPLISSRSLHGKWVEKMGMAGASETELAARILSDLDARGVSSDSSGQYPIGTIAVVERGRVAYYLLALSRFDEGNRAQTGGEDVRAALAALVNFYDRNGQGDDIYLPLVGTGLSRAGLTYRQSYDLIFNAFAEPSSHLAGRATIVITHEAAKELGLKQ